MTSARGLRQVFRRRGRAERGRRERSRAGAVADRKMLRADAALYKCGCGSAFMAAVTTRVACPACGHRQPW